MVNTSLIRLFKLNEFNEWISLKLKLKLGSS